MALRVAIGGLFHESNTYCPGTTNKAAFEVWRGTEMITHNRGVRSYLGGMIAAAESLDMTLVPTFYAAAVPSGTIAADAYAALLQELLHSITAALPVDAVALALHGAAVAEGIDDVDGHVCRCVREVVGLGVPIVVSLDLHGNITQAMADAVDGLFGVHEYPHTDMDERGYEAVALLPYLHGGDMRTVIHVETLPMLLPPSPTSQDPARAFNALCAAIEQRPGVVDCTVFHGFPYADVPHVGVHVVTTTNGDRELARSCAREVAGWLWERRETCRAVTLTPEEAVAQAQEISAGPVVINETSDNPGGGAPGDGTHLLHAMVAARLESTCFGFLYDPEVAALAHQAGVDTTIDVALGSKSDDLHGRPLRTRAYVKCLTDGRFILQAMGKGGSMDLGKMARLQIGGIDVLVSSTRQQTFDPEVFLLHGIDVTRYKIVALKSAQHFRAGFAPLATAILTADSPGLTTLKIERFPRSRAPGPLWPLDGGARYDI